jgi:tellurite resistance protein
MFRRIFGSDHAEAADQAEAALTAQTTASTAGDTATVRRIVAKLEEMPPERARLVASAAYIVARAANADLEISEAETTLIEQQLQERGALDEATAVMVAEMAKLQARTVGGTEDYVVTREFNQIATPEQRLGVVRACFVIAAASGSISAEESAVVNEIANELSLDPKDVNEIRAEFHDLLSSVQEVRRLAEHGG